MIEITPIERRALRASAHALQPVVAISKNGLTAAVLNEIDVALKAHELIKIKLHGIERAACDELMTAICDQLQCAPVQHIGNILVVWRENPEKEAPAASRPRRKAVPKTKKQAAAALERKRK